MMLTCWPPLGSEVLGERSDDRGLPRGARQHGRRWRQLRLVRARPLPTPAPASFDLLLRRCRHTDAGLSNRLTDLFQPHVPFLYLKIGYMLSDLTLPDQGNLQVIAGSHRQERRPFAPSEVAEPFTHGVPGGDAEAAGARQVTAPAGSAVLFHNALWHAPGPFTRPGARRVMLCACQARSPYPLCTADERAGCPGRP